MADLGPQDVLRALVQRDAQLAIARQEIDGLNGALWLARADGYRKADPAYPTLTEVGIVEWSEARRWRRGHMIELDAQAIYDSFPDEWHKLAEATYANFRGIAWKVTVVRPTIENVGVFALGRRDAVDSLVTRRLEINLVATAAPDSKGPPAPTAEPMTYERFLMILEVVGGGSPPVALENGQMGMANHFHRDVVLIDAYRDDEHMGVYRVPYANLIHLGGGAFVASLKDVPPPTGAEGVRS